MFPCQCECERAVVFFCELPVSVHFSGNRKNCTGWITERFLSGCSPHTLTVLFFAQRFEWSTCCYQDELTSTVFTIMTEDESLLQYSFLRTWLLLKSAKCQFKNTLKLKHCVFKNNVLGCLNECVVTRRTFSHAGPLHY